MIYFTSDLHLGHNSVIALCHRPFSSTEEMDETLIANWNAKVRGNDKVYIVGDKRKTGGGCRSKRIGCG